MFLKCALFKSNVRNKNHLKGCITKAYIAYECMIFCSRYLSNIGTQFCHMEQNDNTDQVQPDRLCIFTKLDRPLGEENVKLLTYIR